MKDNRKFNPFLPYVVFVLILLCVGISVYTYEKVFNKELTNIIDEPPIDTCVVDRSNSEIRDTVSVNIVFSIQQLIINKTNSASQYLQNDTIKLDSLKLVNHLSELEQLYSIKNLTDYENEMLITLIREYKRRIKESKNQ